MLVQQFIYTCDAHGCTERVVSDAHEVPKGWCVFNTTTSATKPAELTHGHLCEKHYTAFLLSLIPGIAKRSRP